MLSARTAGAAPGTAEALPDPASHTATLAVATLMCLIMAPPCRSPGGIGVTPTVTDRSFVDQQLPARLTIRITLAAKSGSRARWLLYRPITGTASGTPDSLIR